MPSRLSSSVALSIAALATAAAQAADAPATKAPTAADILAAAPAEAWRTPSPDNLVLMEVGAGKGEVLLELAPRFAPAHAANIRALVRGGYFDGLAVLRVQENYVTQWGDPGDPPGADNAKERPLPPEARDKLPAEFSTSFKDLPFTPLAETDGWADVNGYVDGFQVAADRAKTRAWLAHCYGAVGAGRGAAVDSSNGASLYAVIGQAPRHLDLNITVVGRVLQGMEHLTALPRGKGTLGFYGPGETRAPLVRVRMLSSIPEGERPVVQVLRDDSATWPRWLEARRHRSGWFVHDAGRVDLCSVPAPVRVTRPASRP